MVFYSHRRFRKWIFRGSLILLASILVFMATVFCFGLYASAHRPPAQVDINYYYNVIGDEKVIALTFDDGPLPGKTNKLMDLLESEKVPATFFFIGSRALQYPGLVDEAYKRGFEIGNHTFTHAQTVQSSPQRIRGELALTDTILESITHHQIRLYRPPFLLDIGSDPTTTFPGSRESLRWANDDGYVVVGADVDSKDWDASSTQEVVDRFFAHLKPGRHIALLHDGSSEAYTIAAMPQIIDGLRERGYRFTTVSDLLGLDAAQDLIVSHDLKRGDQATKEDTAVKSLQRFLVMRDHPIIDQSGVFGPSTEKALKAWQKEEGVTGEDGVVGQATRAAIAKSVTATMYQPIPTTQWHSIFLFGDVAHAYLQAGPWIAKGITWLVQIVLILVTFRLLVMITLRIIVAFRKKPRYRPWTKGVSVIIPAYNEEDNIKATVLSVLQSSVENLDIIVMNDGSHDRTAEIVHQLEQQYPDHIRLVTVKNGGKARALNTGFQLARYDVVVTMDGDTIFDHHAIARLVRHFNSPKVMAVAGKVCATSSRNLLNLFQWAEYIISQNMDKEAFNLANAIGVVPGPVGAWRKSVVREAGGYSLDTMVEDQDLTMALIARGYTVLYEPQAYAYSETPFTVRDFVKQRVRWIFGTLQCVWKYKRYLFNIRRPAMGWVVLPNVMIFSFFLSLLIPLMDVLLVTTLIVGFARSTLLLYVVFLAVDLTYATAAFIYERQKQWLVTILPLQRLFYRFVIAYVVWKSVVKAIEGSESRWNKVRKRGDAQAQHLQSLALPVVRRTTTALRKS